MHAQYNEASINRSPAGKEISTIQRMGEPNDTPLPPLLGPPSIDVCNPMLKVTCESEEPTVC